MIFFFVEVVQCELEKWFEYGWSDFCYKEKEKSLGCVLIWKFKIRACDALNGRNFIYNV